MLSELFYFIWQQIVRIESKFLIERVIICCVGLYSINRNPHNANRVCCDFCSV